MAKKVVIVESPAKSRTIARYLGKGFSVVASLGHVVDLPERELAVDIDSGFVPKYEVIPGKRKVISRLKSAVDGAEAVFLASDPDREGEAIAYHIAKLLGILDRARRVLFNEITRDAVREGIEHPTQIDMNKVYAQQARRILDRLVGYKVSPLLWRLLHQGLSAGRVQSVALKILAAREREIEEFKPREYWTIDVALRKDGVDFSARITKFVGEKLEIPTREDAKRHKLAVEESAPFVVTSVERKELGRVPPPPFITSTLQLEASRRLRFSAQKTMQLAQQLYEGIDLGEEGPVGLITYMRTDSVRVADVAIASARKFIRENFGEEYVGNIVHKVSQAAQGAHEAIRPTSVWRTPDKVKPYLTPDQYKLYELIWRRFVASRMAPAKLVRTSVSLAAGDYTAEVAETKVLFDGFLRLWRVKLAEDESEEKTNLPPLSEGDVVELLDVKPKQHFTKPPPRYTEGTLVRELEAQGIGRPSTYAQIISTLLQRKYVRRQKGKLYVTELGKKVNELLQMLFPDIFEEKFTARMEEELDAVERGEKSWQQVLREFYDSFSRELEGVERNSSRIKASLVEEVGRRCPLCGAPLVVRWGRYGRFIACTNFPECRYTEPFDEEERRRRAQTTKLDEKCPQCGATLLVRRNRHGGRFISCSNYPKCKYSRPYSTGIPCPKPDCDGKLLELTSKKGKVFYACSAEGCDFVSFDEPLAEPCPKCGAKSTFVKRAKKGKSIYCALCGWRRKAEEKDDES